MKRVHVFVSGRVQGVFYRAFTREHAVKLGLKGFVRNLRDGRVEAVFEGDEEKIKKMIELLKRGPKHAIVEHVEVIEEEYAREFDRFEIRYDYY